MRRHHRRAARIPCAQAPCSSSRTKSTRLLGTDVSEAEMRRILLALGFELDGDTIIVPSWRGDVEHYSDIAEEVARFYGYNNIPGTADARRRPPAAATPTRRRPSAAWATCPRAAATARSSPIPSSARRSYDKIRLPADSPLRDSMQHPQPARRGHLHHAHDRSCRPCSRSSRATITTATRPCALRDRQGLLRPRRTAWPTSRSCCCLGAYGGGMDFFQLKGAVERILAASAHHGRDVRRRARQPVLSPRPLRAGLRRRQAAGRVRPDPSARRRRTTAWTQSFTRPSSGLRRHARRAAARPPVYTPLPRFPAVDARHLPSSADADIPVAKLSACILAAGGQYLKGCELFDVYTGAPHPGRVQERRLLADAARRRPDAHRRPRRGDDAECPQGAQGNL